MRANLFPVGRCSRAALICCFFILPGEMAQPQTNLSSITIDGRTYTNCNIKPLNAAFATIVHAGGGSKVPISSLPADIQKLLNYDPAAAELAMADQKASAERRKNHRPVTTQIQTRPGEEHLRSITNQIAGLEKKLQQANATANTEEQRYELQFKAGQGSDQLTLRHVKWREHWHKTQTKPLMDQIGKLRLQEFEVRQRYNLK